MCQRRDRKFPIFLPKRNWPPQNPHKLLLWSILKWLCECKLRLLNLNTGRFLERTTLWVLPLIKFISVLCLISFFQKLNVTSKINKIYSNKHQSQYNFFHTKLFTETLKHKESFWIIIQKLDPLTFEHVKMKKFNALIKHLRWQILNWTSHVMK